MGKILHAGAAKPVHLEPVLCIKRSHCHEEPEHCSWRRAPGGCNLRKPARSNEDPAQPETDAFI